jgi:hypothetical protein
MNKWEEIYVLAAVEADAKKLPERIAGARTAVRERLKELEQSSDHHAERRRLAGALRILDVLESESQNW